MSRTVKVWIIVANNTESNAPHLPFVFGSEQEATAAFDKLMRAEWECYAPYDDDGLQEVYPDCAFNAERRMAANGNGEWGRWELTSHDITIQD